MSTTPKIRFEKYTDDWEQRKVDEIGNIVTGTTPSTSNSENYGSEYLFAGPGDIQDNRYVIKTSTNLSAKGLTVSRPVRKGSTLVVCIGSTIGKTAQLSSVGTTNQQINSVEPFENYDDDFIYIALKKRASTFKQECSMQTMPIINKKDFGEIFVAIAPSLREQEKIGEYFRKLDNLITLHQREVAKVINLKQTMLITMFPSLIKVRPEVRFVGFEDNWTSIEFGEIFRKLKNNTFSRDMLNYDSGTVKDIHYGDVLIKYSFSVDCSSDEVPYINSSIDTSRFVADSFLQVGDIVIADTAEDTMAGKVVEIKNTVVSVLGGLHTYPCRPIICFEVGFLGILLNTPYFHNQLIKYMQGTKVTSINYDMFCKALVSYPSKDEQKKIVSFFDTVDGLIKSKEASLRKLVNLKQQLLNKMFA